MGQVNAVFEVKSVFLEKTITYKDGHSTQDERSKQVGMDVVAGATQFPVIKAYTKLSFPDVQNDCIII